MENQVGTTKLDIPVTYDDPHRNAAEIRVKLDVEARRESDAFKKGVSGEHRVPMSPPVSTAVPTPDWKFRVPRSNSSFSDASGKQKRSPQRRSVTSRKSETVDPLEKFADFETSSWPSPQVDNPFIIEDSCDRALTSLQLLNDAEVSGVLERLAQARPALRSVIHSVFSQ
jgi:hypothetical protein